MPSTYGDTTYLTCAETAKLARAALKKAFPGVKFSVRSDGCINISWIDGPTAAQVDAVVSCYAGGRFDGMIDYAYNVSHWLLPDGSAIVARSEGTESQRSYHAPIDNALGGYEDIIDQNFAARLTREEVATLFQGERRDHMYPGSREVLWSEGIRQAYRQMRMEDCSE